MRHMEARGVWGGLGRDQEPVASNSLVVCILPEGATELKIAIKRWGDFEKGIPTQVVIGGKALSKQGNQLNQYWSVLWMIRFI